MTALPTATAPIATRAPHPAVGPLRALGRGREEDARWVRPAVLPLLTGTGVLTQPRVA